MTETPQLPWIWWDSSVCLHPKMVSELFVPQQEGLLPLPAQTQEHGGDTWRPAVT